jgi:hypothetical protein
LSLFAIVDEAHAGIVPEQIMTAIAQVLDQEMTTESKLLGAAKARGGQVERFVQQILESGAAKSTRSGAAFVRLLSSACSYDRKTRSISLVRMRVVFDLFLGRISIDV